MAGEAAAGGASPVCSLAWLLAELEALCAELELPSEEEDALLLDEEEAAVLLDVLLLEEADACEAEEVCSAP